MGRAMTKQISLQTDQHVSIDMNYHLQPRNWLIVVLLLSKIISCTTIPSRITNTSAPLLTIFIHGSVGLQANISLGNLFRLLNDNICNSTYEQTVYAIRHDPFFYQYQPIQELGLRRIDNSFNTSIGAQLFAKLFHAFLPRSEKQIPHHYYTFGWSGLVSSARRYNEAHELYMAIKTLHNKYPNSPIRVVGYSHGGNLALNIAGVRMRSFPDDQFNIDELICIGTPVQKETADYIYNPIFKKIYHFYSRADCIQRLDCFSLRRFFSQRRFESFAHTSLPKNLVQAEIKIFDTMRNVHKRVPKHTVDRSPGHTELWFFGWVNESYRHHFPLYPLPTAVLLPFLIQKIQELKPDDQHVIIEIKPYQNTLSIRSRYLYNRKTAPFVSPKKWISLSNYVIQHENLDLTPTTYQEHLYNAIQQALGYPLKKQKTKLDVNCLCAA
jgi:hypothetical protein